MKRVGVTLLILLATTLVFTIALVVAGFFLEDKFVEKAISQLNSKLDAKINVEKVDFSLIRGFPYASIILQKVDIKEGSLDVAPEFEPGLLSFEKAIIRIGLVGILKNEYDIDELILKDGWINLYFDNSGKGNYQIFRTTENSPTSWLLQLRSVMFENVNISYIDIRTGWIMKGLIHDGKFSGNISSLSQSININTKVKVGLIKQGSFHYFRNQTVSLQANLIINDENVVFNRGFAKIGNAKIELKGNIGTKIGSPISLNIVGNNIEANYLVSFLSQYNISLDPKIKTKGNIAFLFDINGLNKSDNPFIFNLKFKSESFSISLPDKPSITINGIQGFYTNKPDGKPESSLVSLNFNEIVTSSSSFSGSLKLKNTNSPIIHAKLNTNLSHSLASEWGLEVPLKSGNFSGPIELLANLENWDNVSISGLKNLKIASNIQFKNISLEEVGGITISEASGSAEINNSELYIPNVTGSANGSLFNASITVNKPLLLFSNTKKPTMSISLSIDSLNTAWFSGNSSNDQSDDNQSIWNYFENISGFVFINNLLYNNFTSKHTNIDFFASETKVLSNRFVGVACKGSYSGKFSASRMNEGDFNLLTSIEMNQIDISELFTSFENFDQSIIKSNNISGNLMGTVDLNGIINNYSLLTAGLVADCNIRIVNGRLVNVKQLEGLARFISLDELKDIAFEQLENSIRIENECVTIPKMSVASNALNLSVSGKHNFDGTYNYRTELLLSDLLFSKAKTSKPENNEFGQELEDNSKRTKLFLRIDGNSDDFEVSYDRESARESFIDNLRQEKQTLKEILKEEFSFLKLKNRDTTTVDTLGVSSNDSLKPQDSSQKFTIEWDDE